MTRQTGDRWSEDCYFLEPSPTPKHECETCGLESKFWMFDDCKACSAAVIVANPIAWAGNRRYFESRPECAELDREIARQQDALATLARCVA